MQGALPPESQSKNPRRFVLFTLFYNARAYYPVLTVLFLDLGLSLEQFVLLNLVWAASIFLLEIPSGALADTLGRKRLLVVSSILMALEMACLLLAPRHGGTPLFLLCLANRILSGASEACASGADEALAYDSLPENDRAEAWDKLLATAMRARAGGTAIAMMLGGILYDEEFFNSWLPASLRLPTDVVLRLPVLLVMIQALICIALTLTMVEPPRPVTQAKDRLRAAFQTTLSAAKWVISTPRPRIIILGGVLIDGIVRNLLTLQSGYFRLIELPERWFGVIGAVTGLLTLTVPSIARKLNHRFAPPEAFLLIGLASVATFLALAPAWRIYGFIPAMMLMLCIGVLGFTVSRSLHAETDSARRATVLSVKGLAFNLGYGTCSLAFSSALSMARHSHGENAFQSLLHWQAPLLFLGLILFYPWAKRRWNRSKALTHA